MKHLISISDMSRQEIDDLLTLVGTQPAPLTEKILCSLFFEPSTRTRLSFESAALKLGMGVIGTENALLSSSSAKGESLEDTIRVTSSYADIIVLRHPENEAAARAAMVSHVPVINAGNGSSEHPTQTLIDLFTIYQRKGLLDGLTIGFIGDIRNSRTIRSLVKALKLYNDMKFTYFAVKGLEDLDLEGEHFGIEALESYIGDLDVLYLTREQKERGSSSEDYFVLTQRMVDLMKRSSLILHPLPRNAELPHTIDADPRAAYFEQAKNAVAVRMAIIRHMLQ